LSKHILFITGEESGDQHSAKLLKSLLNMVPDLRASGLGGSHLEAAGMHNLMDLTKLAIVGLTGIAEHILSIQKAVRLLKNHLKKDAPDVVVLVDYPGFNLRAAKWIKQHIKCPIVYYISPQVWAWKPKRIETIRKYVDHIAVILPFEYDLYQKENIPVSYVGHPLLETLKKVPDQSSCRKHLGWEDTDKILALCPGSRKMEITKHMPILIEALKIVKTLPGFEDLKLVIPVAKNLELATMDSYCKDLPFPYELVSGQAQYVMKAADVVVVSSGTASLESAILLKPSCIIYKSSWLNYFLAKIFIRVKYLGLSNLLQNRMVIPELLQMDCNPAELAKMINLLFHSDSWRHRMVSDLKALNQLLTPQDDELLPKLVTKYLLN
jgi:lipid-A-disaccharide synthase